MTPTLLDFSQRPELVLHARVIADIAQAAAHTGMAPLIVGAFARDLHLQYRHGIAVQRQTADIDLALAVPDWAAFDAVHQLLVSSGNFVAHSSAAHRLRHHTGWPVDLVPFDGIELADRTIAWPPNGESVMDVFGFREAMAASQPALMPGGVQVPVASLPALALLKIVCWRDRHYKAPRKDAQDLQMILQHYLAAGNEPRLWDEFVDWTQQDDFDYESAGLRMLGQDIRQLMNRHDLSHVIRIISDQTHPDSPARLAGEMNPTDPDRALTWLKAMLRSLKEETPKP